MWKKGSPAPVRPQGAPVRPLAAVAPFAVVGVAGTVALAAVAAAWVSDAGLPGTAGHGPTIFDKAQDEVRATYNNLPIPFVHPPVVTPHLAGAMPAIRPPPYPTTASTIGAPPPPVPETEGSVDDDDAVHVIAPPPAPKRAQMTRQSTGQMTGQITRVSKGSVSPAFPSRHSSKAGALSGSSGPT